MHRTTPRFWKSFEKLPQGVQRVAKKNFQILKRKPAHPSLHFKKVGLFWSVRVGLDYRALAVKDGDDFIWVWIGNHGDYERLVNRQVV